MRPLFFITIVGCALVWGSLVGRAQNQGAKPLDAAMKNPVAATPKAIEEGQKLYQKFCRHCHGARGLGDGPLAPTNPSPANLTDATWDHGSSDGDIFNVIWNGAGPNSEMKPHKGRLSQIEVWQIVNYLRSLGPKP